MLRIHFTDDDLARTTVAASADPLWEVMLSGFRLRDRISPPAFRTWMRSMRADRERAGRCRPAVRMLRALTPAGPYFPDFLTPAEGAFGLEPAVAAIRATPRRRLRRELRMLAATAPLPRWTRSLAEGDPELLAYLGDRLIAYYRDAIEPHAATIQAAVEADRAHRARTLLDNGVQGLLLGMRPLMHWRPPVLEVRYNVDRDLYLDGRGLRLVPSYFCHGLPVALADSALPPVLVYPVDHDYAPAAGGPHDHALVALLGATRAAVLAAVGRGATTSELAHRLGTSAASVSRHTTVLREAGLIATHRHGNAVLHTITVLGSELLAAGPPTRTVH